MEGEEEEEYDADEDDNPSASELLLAFVLFNSYEEIAGDEPSDTRDHTSPSSRPEEEGRGGGLDIA